ncbi:MAG: hypothetical protein WA154_02230 [Moraxellaceae bacterium]
MTSESPVWAVYEEYRTARLNVKYYSARVESLENWSLYLDIASAVTVPSSAVSGLFFLKIPIVAKVWLYVVGGVVILSVIKPFLRFGQRIKLYDQTVSGYRALDHDLHEIVLKIRTEASYSASSKKMFDAAMKKKKALVTNPPERVSNKKLVEKFMLEVDSEIPSTSLFIPPQED